MTGRKALVEALLDRFGETYAEQAGVRLADKPAPLFQLLVLSLLLSARISADVAVAAARELFAAGYRTPRRMRQASWQDRVDALGRGHYRRYDERTSTMLGERLTEFKGIGPAGADIFLREVQAVWPGIVAYADDRVAEGARKLGLPSSARALAGLVDGPGEFARLASALVRISRGSRAAAEVERAASTR